MKKLTEKELNYAKQLAIKEWFRTEFTWRKARLDLYRYFGISELCEDNEFKLMTDAYCKEQKLRELQNKDELPPVTENSLF